MTALIHYPGADRSLYFADRHPGSIFTPNVTVLHTTEGGNVTDYDGGKVAPNITISVRRRKVWEHYPLNMSSRALRNLKGGVETNTLNVVQVEILGSCDPKSRVQPKSYAFTDDELRWLGQVLRQIVALCPQIPLNVTTQPWLRYDASYGNRNGQRMSNAVWSRFRGICGHMHVPENLHGDPSDLAVARALELSLPRVTGGQSKPASTAEQGKGIAPGWRRTDRPYSVDLGHAGTVSADLVARVLRADMAAPDGVKAHAGPDADRAAYLVLAALWRMGLVSAMYRDRGILGTTAAAAYAQYAGWVGQPAGVTVAGLRHMWWDSGINVEVKP